jgi:hypothetical protein
MPSGRWRTGHQLANLLHPGIIGALHLKMDTEVDAVRQDQRMHLASGRVGDRWKTMEPRRPEIVEFVKRMMQPPR